MRVHVRRDNYLVRYILTGIILLLIGRYLTHVKDNTFVDHLIINFWLDLLQINKKHISKLVSCTKTTQEEERATFKRFKTS